MADTSGVTAESLKLKLTEQLQAQFVEIEDLLGREHFFCTIGILLSDDMLIRCRWLWSGFPGGDRLPTVRKQEHACASSSRQLRFEG